MSVAKNSQELCDESGKILNYYVLRPEFNKFSLRYGLHGWAFEGKKKKGMIFDDSKWQNQIKSSFENGIFNDFYIYHFWLWVKGEI